MNYLEPTLCYQRKSVDMNQVKIRICCVIPSLQPGGMERVMSVLANGFTFYSNSEVHLILYGSKRSVFYHIEPSIHVHTPVFEFNKQRRTWNTWKTICFLRKTIREINPSTVLSFGSMWNSLVLLSCVGIKNPVFISDRGTPLRYTTGIHAKLKNILYPTAAGIIVQTKYAENVYRKRFRQKNYCVIGNPIRETIIPEQNQRENIIVSVGRLIGTKNFDRLIKIFEEIGNKDWKLVIIGGDADGQHRLEELQTQRDNSPMKDNIVLAGTQKNVESYLLKAKIFAFTSSEEGFPNAIGEAMSAGLPVVSYDCITGPSEMIEDGKNGYLTEVFDDATFKNRLETLMNDEELRAEMGRNAKESIKQFSEEKIIEKFYQFITEKSKA